MFRNQTGFSLKMERFSDLRYSGGQSEQTADKVRGSLKQRPVDVFLRMALLPDCFGQVCNGMNDAGIE